MISIQGGLISGVQEGVHTYLITFAFSRASATVAASKGELSTAVLVTLLCGFFEVSGDSIAVLVLLKSSHFLPPFSFFKVPLPLDSMKA